MKEVKTIKQLMQLTIMYSSILVIFVIGVEYLSLYYPNNDLVWWGKKILYALIGFYTLDYLDKRRKGLGLLVLVGAITLGYTIDYLIIHRIVDLPFLHRLTM